MKPNRLVVTLAFAAVATPAVAEKCHYCDFSDEPIVVTPKKSVGLTPLDAPAGLAATRPQAAPSAPSVSEVVVTKLTDGTTPGFMRSGVAAPAKTDRPTESLSLNYTKIEYKYIPFAPKGGSAPKAPEAARYNFQNAWPSKAGVQPSRSAAGSPGTGR